MVKSKVQSLHTKGFSGFIISLEIVGSGATAPSQPAHWSNLVGQSKRPSPVAPGVQERSRL
jgi:hypothetical protein